MHDRAYMYYAKCFTNNLQALNADITFAAVMDWPALTHDPD